MTPYQDAKPKTATAGIKHDAGKPRYDLIPALAEREMVDVLTFGADKYGPNNWRSVAIERHVAAAMRHIAEYRQGKTQDDETKKHPLAHAMSDLAFIIETELQEQRNETK